MVDTTQLLSIAFTLISNFTNVVEIPADHVPTCREDLKDIVVGSPFSPVDIYMVHRLGDEFRVRNGVVTDYQSPESFHHKDLRTMLTKFLGPPTLSTNEVVERASHIMRKLTKTGRSVDVVAPKIEAAWSPDVHFFEISWPIKNSPFYNGLGSIEIDARTGRVVFMQLWAKEFNDFVFAAEISNRVYTPGPAPKPIPNPALKMPKPSQAQIRALIPQWLAFCEKFRINPGSQTNLTDIDWIETVVFTNANHVFPGHLDKIEFKNGAGFQSAGGLIIGHVSEDAAFSGAWADKPEDYWKRFAGETNKSWESLANELNSVLVQRLGVLQKHLDKWAPTLYARGRGGVNRCLVRWCDVENPGNLPSYDLRLKTTLLVEFDLGTGEIKTIRFEDPELLKWQR